MSLAPRTVINPTEASTMVATARSVASRRASCRRRSSIAYPERQSSGNTAAATDFCVCFCGIQYRSRIRGWISYTGNNRAGRNACKAMTVDRMKVHLTAHHGWLRMSICGTLMYSKLARSSLIKDHGVRHQFNLLRKAIAV